MKRGGKLFLEEMRRRLEMRDLRSLERRSMYSIFHPLDVNERLPRELILEGKRYRWLEIRHLQIVGFLYLPALILAVVVLGSASLNLLLAFAIAGVALLGIFLYVLSARDRQRLPRRARHLQPQARAREHRGISRRVHRDGPYGGERGRAREDHPRGAGPLRGEEPERRGQGAG